MIHFGGKDVKKHALKALKRLRGIADARDSWRETRIHQALSYPDLRVPITRKLMRLSDNTCMICGRQTHIAGDQLCMELPTYYMLDEKEKKKELETQTRRETRHRITVSPATLAAQTSALQAPGQGGSTRRKSRLLAQSPSVRKGLSGRQQSMLPSLAEDGSETKLSSPKLAVSPGRPTRLGVKLVSKQWVEAEKAGVQPPQRPKVVVNFVPFRSVKLHSLILGIFTDNSCWYWANERHIDNAISPRDQPEEVAGSQNTDRGRATAYPRVLAVRLAQWRQ